MTHQRVFKVGVIGAGNIATVAQLPSLVRRDDVELSGLVTRRDDPSSLLRRWPFRRVFRRMEDMLSADPLDCVFVLTPRTYHVEPVETALRAGVDVFCEKPLATSSADAVRLADVADACGRILMVGFNRRFAPLYRAGREQFGDRGASFCVAQKNRATSEYRATFENAIHMVDLLRWYAGGVPVSVAAHALAPDEWHEDGLAALITFDTGNTGVLIAARNAGGWEETLDAYGGGASVHVDAPERATLTVKGVTTVREMRQEAFGWATTVDSFGFAASVDHFLECVNERREPLTSGREAADTQLLLDRILHAASLPVEENPDLDWTSRATT